MHTESVTVYFDDLDALGVVYSGKRHALRTGAGRVLDPGRLAVRRGPAQSVGVLFAVRECAITYHTPVIRVGTVQAPSG